MRAAFPANLVEKLIPLLLERLLNGPTDDDPEQKRGVPKTTRFSRRTFGLAIRRERERRELSQEEFAERANNYRTYISSIELGKVSIGIEVA